jgi:hypothetical protein
MKTRNNTIGRKIINFVCENQLKRKYFSKRKISREIDLPRRTVDRWIICFREESMIKTDPMFPIFATDETLQDYRNGALFVPLDPDRKKKKIKSKDVYPVLLILSCSAFGSPKYKKIEADQYLAEKKLPGVTINDIVYKLTHKYGSPNPKARFFKNKINFTNMELFGYLQLSRNEAKQYFEKMVKFEYEYPILKEIKYDNQPCFVIGDKKLEEFIKICFFVFGQDVYSILAYLYIFDRLKNPRSYYSKMWQGKYTEQQRGEQIKEYIEHAKLTKKNSSYYRNIKIRLTSDTAEWQWEQVIKAYKKTMEKWFGKQLIRNLHFSSIKEILTSSFDKEFERAIKDIHKCQIFDDKLEGINKKYKILEEKYPMIVKALIDILVPDYFRYTIREEYMKNVTNSSNLLSR